MFSFYIPMKIYLLFDPFLFNVLMCSLFTYCKLRVIKRQVLMHFAISELHQMIKSLEWFCHWKSLDVQCSQYICNDMKNQCNRQFCFLSWTRIYNKLASYLYVVCCMYYNEQDGAVNSIRTMLFDRMCNISW